MTYRISGLPMLPFAPLFDLSDDALADRCAVRVTADADRGFPCRVSLVDADKGDALILLNHVSHDVATPYRTAYAIYVRAAARAPEPYVDRTPPVFDGRQLSLRGFDRDGMLRGALIAPPDEADGVIRTLLDRDEIAYIHAHNAAHGCFAARIDRN
ncbi:DUF1203 domain-containing protein [Sphingobium nicotianae]|uniref:DUF1203 domain-containing protein n=1 Tax=Sphingobium nicotianae TaxID=2782607 RepID=A0A9X1DEJ8_9SPHN|nr:DUF1203 domain-containing protein [Sphingobium nicotianae]MBT2188480.1 DUF1203 domain-containing protein [Sphingobium nicotianae]